LKDKLKTQKLDEQKKQNVENIEGQNEHFNSPNIMMENILPETEQVSSNINELIKKKEEAPLGPNMTSMLRKITKHNVKMTSQKLLENKCLFIKYLRENWKQYFPKNTKTFNFNPGMSDCNFQLLILILKDFNSNFFRNVSVLDIKNMLIHYYKPLIKSRIKSTPLFEKWSKERKGELVNRIKEQNVSIENIIMDENYKISETDILLLSYFLNIPITILYQGKKKIKVSSFQKYQKKHNFRYYIKATNLSAMYLYLYKNNIRFYNVDVDEGLNNEIANNSYLNFSEYLLKKTRK
jgi:hypothetical protein